MAKKDTSQSAQLSQKVETQEEAEESFCVQIDNDEDISPKRNCC